MRRVTLWIVSTIAALVLLFSYRTSLGGGAAFTVRLPAGMPRSGGHAPRAPRP